MKNFIAMLFIIAVMAASQVYLADRQQGQFMTLASQQSSERSQYRALLDSLALKLDEVEQSIGGIKTEYAAARQAQFRELRDSLDAALENQSPDSFRALRDQVDEIINTGALLQDHTLLAREASEKAELAEKAGDNKLAEIYYLSAVNHAPSDFDILKAYASSVLRGASANPSNITQLRSVLQVSLYQLPPSRRGHALALLGTVDARESEILAQQTPRAQTVDWVVTLDQLTSSIPLDTFWRDSSQIQKRLEGLRDIADSLRATEPESELLARAVSERDVTQRVLVAGQLAGRMDQALKSAEAAAKKPEVATSYLQSAEAILGQLLIIDTAGFPDSLRKEIDGAASKLRSGAESIAEAVSSKALEEIDSAMKKAQQIAKTQQESSSSAPPLQNRAEGVRNQVKIILKKSKSVSSVKGREQVDIALRETQTSLADVQREQFNAYQKWALKWISTAFDDFDRQIWRSSEDVKMILDHNHLAAIDQALLSPETSRALNDVLGKLLSKANGETAFDMQKILAEPPERKRQLSDF